ncbi:MAG: hypothetical protein V1734_07160 [Nanoarchaeota archaeon]
MIDTYKVFSEIDGKIFDPVELRQGLELLIAKHRRDIPPEFNTKDLFELARKKGIIAEYGNWGYIVTLPKQ